MRDSFIFYRSFYEAIKELPETNQTKLYNAIFGFCLNHEVIELSGIEKTVWTLIFPLLEANYKRYINGTKAKRKQEPSEPEADPKRISICIKNLYKDKDLISAQSKQVAREPIKEKISFSKSEIEFQGITEKHIGLWGCAYPAVNLDAELNAMCAWLDANPKNKKSDYLRFITNWLKRAQDKAGRVR